MTDHPPLSEPDEAALTAYVDERLEAAERAEFEARLGDEPALAAALEQQRVGLSAISTAVESVSAPLALRARVEELQRGGGKVARPKRERRRGWGWLPGAGRAAAAVAAVAIVVAFSGGPATGEVLAAAVRPPVAAVQ